MRFMMLMLPGPRPERGEMPDAKAIAKMMKYNEDLQKAGVLLALDGLHPTARGARVSFHGGRPQVMDGPFAESKEVIGGYWIIQVKSKAEAIDWAKRCPADEDQVIELRQVYEAEDFSPEALTPEIAAREKALGEDLKKKG